MVKPLWKLVLGDPSSLTCDECFAVMEYYAELLATGSTDLLPKILEHLEGCPKCELEYQEALHCLLADRSEERGEAPAANATRSNGSRTKGRRP